MSIWLFELKMPEDVFWKTMNPARLCSLYDAHFQAKHQSEPRHSLQTGEKPAFSMSAYLAGMGG